MQSSILVDAVRPHPTSVRILSVLLLAGLLVPIPGRTQATAADSSTVNAGGFIEEIIVTAQRRERPLQDVPISVSVFDSAEIEALKLTNIAGSRWPSGLDRPPTPRTGT